MAKTTLTFLALNFICVLITAKPPPTDNDVRASLGWADVKYIRPIFSPWELNSLGDLIAEVTLHTCPEVSSTMMRSLKAYTRDLIFQSTPRDSSNSEFFNLYSNIVHCMDKMIDVQEALQEKQRMKNGVELGVLRGQGNKSQLLDESSEIGEMMRNSMDELSQESSGSSKSTLENEPVNVSPVASSKSGPWSWLTNSFNNLNQYLNSTLPIWSSMFGYLGPDLEQEKRDLDFAAEKVLIREAQKNFTAMFQKMIHVLGLSCREGPGEISYLRPQVEGMSQILELILEDRKGIVGAATSYLNGPGPNLLNQTENCLRRIRSSAKYRY